MLNDYYLMSSSQDALQAFCAPFLNVIGVVQGRTYIPQATTEQGEIVPEQAAAGDPEKFYACLRMAESLGPLAEGLEACDKETGAAVLGTWA